MQKAADKPAERTTKKRRKTSKNNGFLDISSGNGHKTPTFWRNPMPESNAPNYLRKTVTAHRSGLSPMDAIKITALIDPKSDIQVPNTFFLDLVKQQGLGGKTYCLEFQRGMPHDGPNDLSMEALLAVVIERLNAYQGNQITRCRENACAITKLEEAMHWLHARTRRIAAGDGKGPDAVKE